MDNLFQHQVSGIEFLLRGQPMFRGKILADDPGLGKTRQAIIAAEESGVDCVLIICPASIKLNWQLEILAMYSDACVHVVNSKNGFRKLKWVIINYDLLKKYEAELLACNFGLVIIDEAHECKNPKAIRSRIIKGDSPKARIKKGDIRHQGILNQNNYRYLLTGTPIVSRTLDLFNLLSMIDHPLGRDWFPFAYRYCGARKGRFGLETKGASNLGDLRNKLEGSILRRMKQDCLDLPDKIRRVIPVEVDKREYNLHWSEYVRERKESGRVFRPDSAIVRFTKMMEAVSIEKVDYTIELANSVLESDQKVIIFTNYNNSMDALITAFPGAAVIRGGMSDTARQKAVDAFQNDPACKVFLGNLKAAGQGITLTASSQVIVNDLCFVPGRHLQGEDRAMRIGQRSQVTCTYVVAGGTIDEKIMPILADKMKVISKVVDGNDHHEESVYADLIEQLEGI